MPTLFQMPSVTTMERTGHLQHENVNLQLDRLEHACRTLDVQIVKDCSHRNFFERPETISQDGVTVSGLSDCDYQNLSALINHDHLSQLRTVNKIPLPPEMMEHFSHMQCHCLMGLFPEISRAWLTIDSDIYVWAFEHGSDVAYFDGLGETIISVGLAKPKPGVFQEFVKNLLILTTTVEIVILGVTFSSGPSNGPLGALQEMHLVPEPVFVMPTDGVSMMVVQPTTDGRIFMGGKDGCLYEITYQAQVGWFGKQSKKVNHSTGSLSFLVPSFINATLYDEDAITRIGVDDERHILYTLSEKGSIEMYDLGEDGTGMRRVIKLSQSRIVQLVTDIVKTLEGSHFRPVVSISAIEKSESEYLNLVAVTQTGVRLYFTAGTLLVTENGRMNQRPHSLRLLHVRLPPGFAANAQVLKPKDVHTAVYHNGTLLMVSNASPESELLWCVSDAVLSHAHGALGQAAGALLEAHDQLHLDGPAWALRPLADLRDKDLSPALLSQKDKMSGAGCSRWVALTAVGAALLQQLGPAELLRQLLVDCHGPQNPKVKAFFQLQCEEQACASALQLACACGEEAGCVAEWAARAFFMYGGQPTLASLPPPQQMQRNMPYPGSPQFSPRQMSTPMTGRTAANVHQSLQAAVQPPSLGRTAPFSPGYPASPQQYQMNATQPHFPTELSQSAFGMNRTMFQQQEASQVVQFSAKHNGFYIYVGRILQPIWKIKCVTKTPGSTKSNLLMSSITGADCWHVLQQLYGVRAFLDKHTLEASPLAAMQRPERPDAQLQEKHSLDALQHFVVIACETLSLWKVLCEHQFHVVAATLPADQQAALLAASFRELLVGGQEIASLLIFSLINQYLTDNASVDSISDKLRQVCPNLYRSEDAACSKANEILLFAKQQKSTAEQEEMLAQAVKLCKDVAPHINLPLVCAKLVAVGWLSGVVELVVACAAKLDPGDAGLHYYRNDKPAHDQEGSVAYYRRMEVYLEVTSVLQQLLERSVGGGGGGGCVGAALPDEADALSPADANFQARKLVTACLSQCDELLHVCVYEWLVSRRLHGELVGLARAAPASLRDYVARQLRRLHAAPRDTTHLHDLLWKFYEACGEHRTAAEILEKLATDPRSGVQLSQRLAYLCQGAVCLAGGEGGGGGGELLRRLEESAEVARVQARVLRAVQHARVQPSPQAMRRLHDQLLDINTLYEEYAEPLELWECKLAIAHCSGTSDAMLVESIWAALLAREAEAARAREPVAAAQQLLDKVRELQYVHPGPCFPLPYLVRQLEVYCCGLGARPGCVVPALLDMGVSLDQLIHNYIRLMGLNERVWMLEGNELHLAEASLALLERVAGAGAAVTAGGERAARQTLAQAHDLLSATLHSLYAKPHTQQLVKTARSIQARLERMDHVQ